MCSICCMCCKVCCAHSMCCNICLSFNESFVCRRGVVIVLCLGIGLVCVCVCVLTCFSVCESGARNTRSDRSGRNARSDRNVWSVRNSCSGGLIRFGPADCSFRSGTIVPADRSVSIFKKSSRCFESILLIEIFNHFRFHLPARDAADYCHNPLLPQQLLVSACCRQCLICKRAQREQPSIPCLMNASTCRLAVCEIKL